MRSRKRMCSDLRSCGGNMRSRERMCSDLRSCSGDMRSRERTCSDIRSRERKCSYMMSCDLPRIKAFVDELLQYGELQAKEKKRESIKTPVCLYIDYLQNHALRLI